MAYIHQAFQLRNLPADSSNGLKPRF